MRFNYINFINFKLFKKKEICNYSQSSVVFTKLYQNSEGVFTIGQIKDSY